MLPGQPGINTYSPMGHRLIHKGLDILAHLGQAELGKIRQLTMALSRDKVVKHLIRLFNCIPMKLTGNQERHKILDKFGHNQTTDYKRN